MEKGQIMVSVFTMIEIAKVLDVSISYLLVGGECENAFSGTEIENIYIKLKKCSISQRKTLIWLFEQYIEAIFLQ